MKDWIKVKTFLLGTKKLSGEYLLRKDKIYFIYLLKHEKKILVVGITEEGGTLKKYCLQECKTGAAGSSFMRTFTNFHK